MQSVWPDVGVKSSPNVSKSYPRSSNSSFCKGVMFFKITQKLLFLEMVDTKNFQKSSNLVTLFATSNHSNLFQFRIICSNRKLFMSLAVGCQNSRMNQQFNLSIDFIGCKTAKSLSFLSLSSYFVSFRRYRWWWWPHQEEKLWRERELFSFFIFTKFFWSTLATDVCSHKGRSN